MTKDRTGNDVEVVINVSEGLRSPTLRRIVEAAGSHLLDIHSDEHHNRSVLTIWGVEAAREVARTAVETIDIATHRGAHPRLGALDVVPFVSLSRDESGRFVDGDEDVAIAARDSYAEWVGEVLGVPTFIYGPERTLPEIRRDAFEELWPDYGPSVPHPTAGSTAVGARAMLVAYNVWVDAPLERAKEVAAEIRCPPIRTLGLQVGDRVQVSMNLIRPLQCGPADAFDNVAQRLAVTGAELVGLVPTKALEGIPQRRWAELDLSDDRTIEARVEALR